MVLIHRSQNNVFFRLFLVKICSKWYLKLFLIFVEEQVYDPKQQSRGISEDINTLSRMMAGPCYTCITLVMFVLAFLHNLTLVESSSIDEQNSLTQVLLLTFIEYNHINIPVVTFQRLYCHLQNLKLTILEIWFVPSSLKKNHKNWCIITTKFGYDVVNN